MAKLYVEPWSPDDQPRASAGDAAPIGSSARVPRKVLSQGEGAQEGRQMRLRRSAPASKRCSLRLPALPEAFILPRLCGLLGQLPSLPVCLGRREGKAAGSLSSKPHVVETVLGGSADTSTTSAAGLSSGGPPASHILVDALSYSEMPPPTPAGLEVSPRPSLPIRTEETGAQKSWHSDGESQRGFLPTRATAQRVLPWRWAEGSADRGAASGAGLRHLWSLCLGSWEPFSSSS